MTVGLALRRGFQRLGMRRARKTQAYRCRYQVAITNRGREPVALGLLFPLPPSLPYQQVADLVIDPPAAERRREARHHNTYAHAVLSVPGEGSVPAGFSATLTVRPRFGAERYEPPLDRVSDDALSGDRYLAVTPEVRRIATDVSGGVDDPEAIIRRSYEYVVGRLAYGRPIEGLYSSEEALRLPQVDCGGFCALLAALLAARGIPSRLLVGFFADAAGSMHAWLEARLPDGRWLVLDPSIDYLFRHGRTMRLGRLGEVGSDRLTFSLGSDLVLTGDGSVVATPILQHPMVVPQPRAGTEVRLTVQAQPL